MKSLTFHCALSICWLSACGVDQIDNLPKVSCGVDPFSSNPLTICANPVFSVGDPLKASTRAMAAIIRELPSSGDGCDALWSEEPTGLAEAWVNRSYPIAAGTSLGAPINLSTYARLTVLVYAYDDAAAASSSHMPPVDAEPIAGGCRIATITAEAAAADPERFDGLVVPVDILAKP